MKLQLKNVHFHERASEETYNFTADLFINGKKVAHVRNSGRGGSTYCMAYSKEDWATIEAAESYCKLLPPIKLDNFTIANSLDIKIDELFCSWLAPKNKKKIEKLFVKSVVYDDKGSINTITWKNHTIASMMASPGGRVAIKNSLAKVRTKGGVILNDNIDEGLL